MQNRVEPFAFARLASLPEREGTERERETSEYAD